jgi:hypothetical protein
MVTVLIHWIQAVGRLTALARLLLWIAQQDVSARRSQRNSRGTTRKILMPTPEFDPDVYFAIVADSLITKFGECALQFADVALAKMQALGDDEGLIMWEGVQCQLVRRIRSIHVPKGVTIH